MHICTCFCFRTFAQCLICPLVKVGRCLYSHPVSINHFPVLLPYKMGEP